MTRVTGRVGRSVLALALIAASASTAAAAEDRARGSESSGSRSGTLGAVLQRLQVAIPGLAERLSGALARPGVVGAAADVEPVPVVRSGRRSSGAVALTFDDGTDRAACTRIADALRAHGAVGTFFVNGNHLKEEPDEWRRILEGMPVANHTRSHRNLTREDPRVIRKQIRENEAIHERLLGRPMLKLLRPPYGAFGPRVRRIATELGYEQLVLWSVDTHDWRGSSSAAQIVRRATGARPGAIILMHCSRAATARALPRIIRHYQARGIELAGLDVVLGAGTGVPAPARMRENVVGLIDS